MVVSHNRTGAYSHNVVAWEAVRVLAGAPLEPKRYYLARGRLEPPEELQTLIFPLLENSLEQMNSSIQEAGRDSEIAGKSFMKLLKHLRVVILQDAVFLSDEVPLFDPDRLQRPSNIWPCSILFPSFYIVQRRFVAECVQYPAAVLPLIRTGFSRGRRSFKPHGASNNAPREIRWAVGGAKCEQSWDYGRSN